MEADELVNSSALQMLLLRVVLWSCELQSNEIRKVSRRRRESLQLLINKTSLRTDVFVYSTYLSYTLPCLFIFLIAYLINYGSRTVHLRENISFREPECRNDIITISCFVEFTPTFETLLYMT